MSFYLNLFSATKLQNNLLFYEDFNFTFLKFLVDKISSKIIFNGKTKSWNLAKKTFLRLFKICIFLMI